MIKVEQLRHTLAGRRVMAVRETFDDHRPNGLILEFEGDCVLTVVGDGDEGRLITARLTLPVTEEVDL